MPDDAHPPGGDRPGHRDLLEPAARGRFRFGVGTGEALNEHILGDRWPPADLRLDMLAEAIEVIRPLWTGEQVTHRGEHYTVENARIYTPRRATSPS